MRRHGTNGWMFLVLASGLLCGCGGLLGKGTVEPTRFFLLEAISDPNPAGSGPAGDLAIGIGPVELPRYLDRPSMVTRGNANEMRVADFVQWGEPLTDGVSRAIAENLVALLGTERVYGVPAKLPEPLSFRIAVDVIRFDGTLGGEVRLEARWTLLDLRQGSNVVSRRFSVQTRASQGSDYGALVAAMSRAVADLSAEIAQVLRDL